MSRSYKKPIWKENGFGRKLYRRITKRSIKNSWRSNIQKLIEGEYSIPNEKTIINDYTYCDYIINCINDYKKNGKKWKKRNSDDNLLNDSFLRK